jgi:hypothetical protein
MNREDIISMRRRMPNLFYTPLAAYLIGLLVGLMMGYLFWGQA